ncbi:MAG: sulfatase-like hydrolase/transferase, partial [Acidobacteriota bacterium]
MAGRDDGDREWIVKGAGLEDRSSWRDWGKAAAVGLGLAVLCLLWVMGPVVKLGHLAIYHWGGRARDLFVPVAADFVLGWAALTAVVALAQRPGRRRRVIWAVILLLTPAQLAKNIALLEQSRMWGLDPVLLVAGVVGLGVLWASWRPAWEHALENVIGVSETVLAFAAVSGVGFLLQMGWSGWEARGFNNAPVRQVRAGEAEHREGRPRVIWIVFDELSFEQVYGRRFAGLKLPAFDALAGQASVFTEVQPEGWRTDRIFPALMTGRMVREIRSTGSGRLEVAYEGAREWKRFDARDTVFEDALRAGYSTAVVGWYNPYCRLLGEVLDGCAWKSNYEEENGMVSEGTVRENMAQPMRFLLGSGAVYGAARRLGMESNHDVDTRLHIDDYVELKRMAEDVLRNPKADFLLLHLPVPHPTGIYDRRTGEMTMGTSSYVDNLALTDKCLGELMEEMKETGQWENSTVLVMGDHGWRTTLVWKSVAGWTAEDEAASGGRFDPRPAYIVKLAGQTEGARIDAA